jgi:hypothetical protein
MSYIQQRQKSDGITTYPSILARLLARGGTSVAFGFTAVTRRIITDSSRRTLMSTSFTVFD